MITDIIINAFKIYGILWISSFVFLTTLAMILIVITLCDRADRIY